MFSMPPGFEDRNFPDFVYRLLKALYRLKQAPRAWYETLSQFLIENHFIRGIIDKTLFHRNFNGSSIFVQEYMWMTLHLGLLMRSFASKFAKLMQSKYEISMMGELTYFIGFQYQIS